MEFCQSGKVGTLIYEIALDYTSHFKLKLLATQIFDDSIEPFIIYIL